VTKANNIIELNGNRYDARTGAPLGAAISLAAATGKPAAEPPHHGRVMDGVFNGPAPAIISPKPAPAAHPTHRTAHAPKPLVAHQPQHTKTLRRDFVKAPAVQPKQSVRVLAPADLGITKTSATSALYVKPKLSSEHIDSDKAKRAQHTPRSATIAHFERGHQPFAHRPHTAAAQPVQPSVPAPQHTAGAQPQHTMFERAIAGASSHEQPPARESHRHKTRRGVRKHARRLSISAAVVAMLLLGSFVAYQNKVALEMQLASARAGFPASMPGYHVVGFVPKQLTYGPGSVTIGFMAGNNQSFKLVQQQSSWDSETLLQNYVAVANRPYQAYQAAGRTVYTYGAGNATWVSGGTWYQVSGNAHLSNNQLIDLATSM
jgi:hypothetical protein